MGQELYQLIFHKEQGDVCILCSKFTSNVKRVKIINTVAFIELKNSLR